MRAVMMLTRSSVHWADKMVATSSSNGVWCTSSHQASGYVSSSAARTASTSVRGRNSCPPPARAGPLAADCFFIGVSSVADYIIRKGTGPRGPEAVDTAGVGWYNHGGRGNAKLSDEGRPRKLSAAGE